MQGDVPVDIKWNPVFPLWICINRWWKQKILGIANLFACLVSSGEVYKVVHKRMKQVNLFIFLKITGKVAEIELIQFLVSWQSIHDLMFITKCWFGYSKMILHGKAAHIFATINNKPCNYRPKFTDVIQITFRLSFQIQYKKRITQTQTPASMRMLWLLARKKRVPELKFHFWISLVISSKESIYVLLLL